MTNDGANAPAPLECNARATVLARAVSRRDVIIGGAAGAVALVVPRAAGAAGEERSAQFQEAFRKYVGDVIPPDGPLKLDLPDLAENGNMVPFTVSFDSPMTPASHVARITIFSTGNPQPVIARFHLTPASGRAWVSGRLRLARSQDVVVVAELNTGELVKATANVSVTVGGCGIN